MAFAIPSIITAIAIWFIQEKYGQAYQGMTHDKTEEVLLVKEG